MGGWEGLPTPVGWHLGCHQQGLSSCPAELDDLDGCSWLLLLPQNFAEHLWMPGRCQQWPGNVRVPASLLSCVLQPAQTSRQQAVPPSAAHHCRQKQHNLFTLAEISVPTVEPSMSKIARSAEALGFMLSWSLMVHETTQANRWLRLDKGSCMWRDRCHCRAAQS